MGIESQYEYHWLEGMSVDISHKKIIKNDNDIIVFEKILWGIFFTSGGIFFIVFIEELLFNLFLSIFVFTGISLIFDENETINFDRRFQKIYLKSRRLFLEKGKERTIKFSEILYPSIKEDGGDGLSAPLWDIILTLKSGETKTIFRCYNFGEAEKILDKIHAFLREDEVSISTSKGSISEYSLHHRTLS